MFKRNFVQLACMTVVVMALLFLPATSNQATNVATGQMALALQAPPFVNVVHAAQARPAAFDLGAYLDQEAGISAYFHSPDAITLSLVRGQFRTIELETPDYIIGSVAVPNYSENFDVHVYVSANGWILAYYLRSDLTNKIIAIRSQTIDTTKLKTVVGQIAGAAGAPFIDVTYYDFRYPNATNMLFVAEDQLNGNDFTIQLPSSFGYFDRGWSMLCTNNAGGADYFTVDGVDKQPSATYGNSAYYGTLTVSELLPDTPHTIAVGCGGYQANPAYGVLIITYRVP
ncbi:MAG: hypothetical protein HY870_10860 [Chloroflexi bacterium]|nr:hypothetical protein [Chloroflexota bacterium]